MKLFTTVFLAFSLFLGFNQLSASETNNVDHLTYVWRSYEEDLCLIVNVSKGLVFSDNYKVMETKDGRGQACEIVCRPVSGVTILSAEGHELQEIKFTALLVNTDDPNKVAFTTEELSVYRTVYEKGFLTSTTSKSIMKGILDSPAIDVTKEPEFYEAEDDETEGAIFFRNSFPYSQLQ